MPEHQTRGSFSYVYPVRQDYAVDTSHRRNESIPAERSSRSRKETDYGRVRTRSRSKERIYEYEESVPRGRRRDSYREKDDKVYYNENPGREREREREKERMRDRPSWARINDFFSRGDEKRPGELVSYTRSKKRVETFYDGDRGRRGRRESRDEEAPPERGRRRYIFKGLGGRDTDITVRIHR